jgi:hypothetical protein
VVRTFVVRKVQENDRAKWEGWAQAEEEPGEVEMAQMTRDTLRKWEQEGGRERGVGMPHLPASVLGA